MFFNIYNDNEIKRGEIFVSFLFSHLVGHYLAPFLRLGQLALQDFTLPWSTMPSVKCLIINNIDILKHKEFLYQAILNENTANH